MDIIGFVLIVVGLGQGNMWLILLGVILVWFD